MLLNDWEKVYSSSIFRNKNQYPSEEIISFMMRNYGELKNKTIFIDQQTFYYQADIVQYQVDSIISS